MQDEQAVFYGKEKRPSPNITKRQLESYFDEFKHFNGSIDLKVKADPVILN